MPGGGTALLQAQPALDGVKLEGDAQIGVSIVRRALEAPIRQIAENAGQEGSVVVAAVRELPTARATTRSTDEYGDMFDEGIVDPPRSHVRPCRTPLHRRHGAHHRDAGHRPARGGEGARRGSLARLLVDNRWPVVGQPSHPTPGSPGP